MTKILIKKQLMEVFSWIYQDKKTGKNRDKKGMLLYVFSMFFCLVFWQLFFIIWQLLYVVRWLRTVLDGFILH